MTCAFTISKHKTSLYVTSDIGHLNFSLWHDITVNDKE